MTAGDNRGEVAVNDLVGLRALVRRVVEARVRDPETVDDLVQETLARVIAAADRLDEAAFPPYAVATARNLVSSLARQQSRDRRHRHRLVDLVPPEGPEAAVLRREEEDALALAFAKLPPEEQRALASQEVLGATLASLAEESGSTPGAIAVRMARARARLRVEYVLSLRRVDLPTAKCKPVLLALSFGDQRLQRRVGVAQHLLACPVCASLTEPLLQRSRPPVWPLVALGDLMRRPSRWARSNPAQAGGAATAVAAVTVATVVLAQPDPGSLRAGDRSLLPPRPGDLAAVAGHQAEGRSLTVEEVAAPSAFWVGPSRRDRVFVEIQGPPPFSVAVGQKVSFIGRIQANHADPSERFEMSGQDAAQLRQQGHHLDVDPDALRPG